MKPRDLLLALGLTMVWGFTFVVIDVGLHNFPPLLFSALRFCAAAFPAVFFVRRGNVPTGFLVRFGLVFGVAYFAFLFVGMDLGMPAGLSSLVVQSQALFTAVLSAFLLGDSPTSRQKLGLTLALVGIGIIGWEYAAGASLAGFLLVLGSAVTWGVSNIMLKKSGGTDMFRLMVWMSLVPIVPLLALSMLFETGQVEALANITLTGVGAILYVGLVATVVGFGMWGHLMRRYSPNVVAPFSLLVPVFGMVLASVLLGESFSALRLVGVGVVFAGLVINVLGGKPAGMTCARMPRG